MLEIKECWKWLMEETKYQKVRSVRSVLISQVSKNVNKKWDITMLKELATR